MIFYGMIPMDLVNWPGKVTATIFTAGCNLRCPYCHNSDLVLNKSQDTYSEDDVISFLVHRKGIQGLVVSGGEPTIHSGLASFLRKVKDSRDIPVKLDTNGLLPEAVETLIREKLVDYIAMDIKAPWNKYEEVGVKDDLPIRKTLDILRSTKIPFELRTTCSKKMLTEDDIEQIIGIAKGDRFYLQPFDPHSTLDPEWAAAAPWTKEELQQIAARHIGVFVR